MNKQEAIEKIKNIGTLSIYDKVAGQQVDMVIKNEVLDTIYQIDEPQKVVVPKFVAEWIEAAKETHNNLSWVWFSRPSEIKMQKWLDCNTEKFMRAWLDGYEVEKEQLYVVNLGKIVGLSIYLRKIGKQLRSDRGDWSTTGDIRFAERLTETEIKQKDERLWQFAESVEE